jgi:chemotaxis protein CheY-P-specific phosphatase CheC
LEGIVVAVFPLTSTKFLTELSLKQYLKKVKDRLDSTMKLSVFKEAANIMVLTYINAVANALKVKIEMNIPKFACFRNGVEFMKQTSRDDNSNSANTVSVGQFRITGKTRNLSPIKGCFIIVF